MFQLPDVVKVIQARQAYRQLQSELLNKIRDAYKNKRVSKEILDNWLELSVCDAELILEIKEHLSDLMENNNVR